MTIGRTNRISKRRAIALIWVAMMGLAFIGFIGLALDTANVLTAGAQLQAVADAASLAGAAQVRASALTACEPSPSACKARAACASVQERPARAWAKRRFSSALRSPLRPAAWPM